MPRYTKTLTDLLRRGGITTALEYLAGGTRGLPVINTLRRIYPQLTLRDVGRLYQRALADFRAAQRAASPPGNRRGRLADIPLKQNLRITSPGVNRVRYDVRVGFRRSSLKSEQVTTVYVDSPRPLTAAQLRQAADAAFWAQVATIGGSPPFLPGESIHITRWQVFSVYRSH